MNAAPTFPEVCTLVKFNNPCLYSLKPGRREFRTPACFIEGVKGWRLSHEDEETSYLLTSERGFPLFRSPVGGTWHVAVVSGRCDVACFSRGKSPKSLRVPKPGHPATIPQVCSCVEECWRSCRGVSESRMSFAGRVAGRRRRSPSCCWACWLRRAGPRKLRAEEPTTSTSF